MPAATRSERIEARDRNPKWRNPPLRIEMAECINCDACLRHCPPQFGAIFNHGIDVIILPELCSGCDKCLPACPVDCIYLDPNWQPSPEEWWKYPGEPGDPYTGASAASERAERAAAPEARGAREQPPAESLPRERSKGT